MICCVALRAHLRVRPDFGGSEQSEKWAHWTWLSLETVEGATASPRGGGPYRADSHQGELKGAQERPKGFLQRTLRSTSKRRGEAA